MNDLARVLLDGNDDRPVRLVYGVATALNTVAVRGAATAVELPALQPVQTGDYCAVLEQGADRLIVGAVGVTTKTTTTGITAETGWQVNQYLSWRMGAMLQFRIEIERTGSAVTNNTSGNIGNQTVATLPTSEQGSINYGLPIVGGGPSGRVAAGTYTPSTGAIQLTSIGGTSDFATNETLNMGGFVLLSA